MRVIRITAHQAGACEVDCGGAPSAAAITPLGPCRWPGKRPRLGKRNGNRQVRPPHHLRFRHRRRDCRQKSRIQIVAIAATPLQKFVGRTPPPTRKADQRPTSARRNPDQLASYPHIDQRRRSPSGLTPDRYAMQVDVFKLGQPLQVHLHTAYCRDRVHSRTSRCVKRTSMPLPAPKRLVRTLAAPSMRAPSPSQFPRLRRQFVQRPASAHRHTDA